MRSSAVLVVVFAQWLVAATPHVVRQVSLPGGSNPTISTPSSTATTPPSPSQSLTFNTISTMYTCGTGYITWQYTGSPGNLTLQITNQGVSQSAPSVTQSPSILRRDGDLGLLKRQDTSGSFGETMNTSVDPFSNTYQWAPVDLPQGRYIIQGFVNGLVASSSPFPILTGLVTSCLVGTSSPTSSSTSSSSTPAATSPAGPDPSAVLVSSHKTNAGAIAGGVIGGVALLAAVVAASFLLRACNRLPRRRSHGQRLNDSGKWGGLASTDSHDPFAAMPKTQPRDVADDINRTKAARHHSQSGSVGPILSNHDSIPTSPVGSEEDVAAYTSEKIISPASASEIVDGIAPLSYAHDDLEHRVSTNSLSHHPRARAVTATVSSHSSAGTVDSHGRQRSSLDGGSNPRSNHSNRSNSQFVTPTSPRSPTEYPPSPSDPVSPSRVGSGNTATRRTPRKAVPKYDASELGHSSGSNIELPALPSSASVRSYGTGGYETDYLPELNHKSSFGKGDNRPVHFLIPDAPLSRD